MKPTRVAHLLAWFAGVGLVAFALLMALAARGIRLPAVSYLVAGIELLLAAVVIVAGLTLRSYLRGNRPGLTGLRAARMVVLGKAASHAGAMLAGWYGAQALYALGDIGIEPQRARLVSAAVAALCATVLAAAGYITERFGRIPPPEGTQGEDAHGQRQQA
ncbi:DUF3180 domain-containing protein [Rarobacter incanus]|uniref:Uncharacterized protein DUF3180 n=1 Tax=Rarobacter incanus TaxID=153494 RepID=A0A542SNZ7_9MICO|nr:DUF3180 domain-containing protein [Rarobacter incanus]TQK76361.1 uncharacterized protein DUF3180 [Rarobacter incanus]